MLLTTQGPGASNGIELVLAPKGADYASPGRQALGCDYQSGLSPNGAALDEASF
jgi:hypothetical protein